MDAPCVFRQVTSKHKYLDVRYLQAELGIPMAGLSEVLSACSSLTASSLEQMVPEHPVQPGCLRLGSDPGQQIPELLRGLDVMSSWGKRGFRSPSKI